MVTIPVNVYIGYYNEFHYPIIVGTEKELIIEYFKSHRFLNKSEFRIEKETMTENEIFLNYSDQCITQYERYYIPSIDVEIIESNENPIQNDLDQLLIGIKDLILLSQDIKKIKKEELNQLIGTMQVLSKFKNNTKIMYRLERNKRLNNSILFLKMNLYIQQLQYYKETRELKRLYNYQMEKDEY